MSGGIVSKNLYELLGNDPEQDPERAEPQPPTTAVEKPIARTGRRNAPADAPAASRPAAGARGGRQDSATGNERAFQDRSAGSVNNRGKPVDDSVRFDRHSDRLGGGRVQQRGRGGRGRGGDRHSRTNHADTEKQTAQGWGAQKGDSEWNDEKAGEAIAKAEEKEGDAVVPAAVDAEGRTPAEDAEQEPEDKSKSYAEYLAELAQKRLNLSVPEAREPSEGKQDNKFKEVKRAEEEEAYIAGAGGKHRKEKTRNKKNYLDVDLTAETPRGGREGGRGGRGGRGDFRGGDRGRGGRGRGDSVRGGGRGGRGGANVNVTDPNAFPSLGA
ncbi:MAG: hypothetical protein M1819_003866 [Sarea resinae]|nr:MAG: hypothetical protein M1819_003866 [Sarea resinae]